MCIDTAKDPPDQLPALEAELNALVYQAYGLDADDIAVIKGSIGGKKGVQLSSEESESGDGG